MTPSALTFDELAERSGLSTASLMRYLNGQRFISFRALEQNCDPLNVPPAEVVQWPPTDWASKRRVTRTKLAQP